MCSISFFCFASERGRYPFVASIIIIITHLMTFHSDCRVIGRSRARNLLCSPCAAPEHPHLLCAEGHLQLLHRHFQRPRKVWTALHTMSTEVLCAQGSKHGTDDSSKHTQPKEPPLPNTEATNSCAPVAAMIGTEAKGPRRRNRAERAAAQQEQDLAEQQESRRRLW